MAIVDKPEGPFVIMINKRQQELLVDLIGYALCQRGTAALLASKPTNDVYPDNLLQEAQMLRDHFRGLPEHNQENTDSSWGANGHSVHGFCI